MRPGETRESFWEYAGMTPEMAAHLVAQGRLIPQIYVEPEDFAKSKGGTTFAPVLDVLIREELPLSHANNYETLVARKYGLVNTNDGEWADLKKEQTDALPKRQFTAEQEATYQTFLDREPVAPSMDGLRAFTGERIAWQLLEKASAQGKPEKKAAKKNGNRLRRAWNRKTPEKIYWTGHLAHFGVTPRYYCRDGLAWRTKQDIQQIIGANESFRCAFGDTGARVAENDGAIHVRLHVPRFTGNIDPGKFNKNAKGIIESFRRNVWGSEADRFWHRTRALEAKSRPKDVFDWHQDVALDYLLDHWEPVVQSHARGEARRKVASLRLLQAVNATPTLTTLIDILRNKGEEVPALDDVSDFLYLLKGVVGWKEDVRSLASVGLKELMGHATLSSHHAAMAAVVDPSL